MKNKKKIEPLDKAIDRVFKNSLGITFINPKIIIMKKENYIPFGEQWKNEVLKHSKSQIIDLFLKPSLIKNQDQENEIGILKVMHKAELRLRLSCEKALQERDAKS